MKSLKVVSFILLIVVCAVQAQNRAINAPVFLENDTLNIVLQDSLTLIEDTVNSDWNHLTIISDSRINDLLEIQKEESIQIGGFKGFRVQVYQGTKDEAYQIKSRFMSKYPNYKVYVFFEKNDFKVRIGDFRTRSEAIKLMSLIQNDYNELLIPENEIINFPDLIESSDKNE